MLGRQAISRADRVDTLTPMTHCGNIRPWTAIDIVLLLLLSLLYPAISSASFRKRNLVAFASPSIPPPPPISMPVWSLACPCSKDTNGNTSMNIVTFATPVSVAPPKLWIVSLYTNTMTRDCCLESRVGVLQLLTPSMSQVVPLLGKRSGYEEGYSKQKACQEAGYECVKSDSDFVVKHQG